MVQPTILKIFNRMMNQAVASDSEWPSNKLETLNGGLASAETVIKLDETVYWDRSSSRLFLKEQLWGTEAANVVVD